MAYKRITKFAISIILSVSMILELAGIVPIYTKAAIDNTKAAEPEAGQETVSPFLPMQKLQIVAQINKK